MISHIFDSRRTDRDALAQWVPRLAAAQTLSDPLAGLRQVAEALAKEEAREPLVIRVLRTDIESAIDTSERGARDPAERIKTLLSLYEKRYAAAVTHSEG